ncbi:hypothetical protein P691DRAFT_122603 [Macrolepiota fuliginosa MF-IS2]|uniref:Uncharacterized protein n=1 Tax=Macrolepiota fuliginosa MF-IS2 TaxID=1400762 RepID=A0A9P5X9P8_9AGAR|nr:hypothetical protein P691DRAFT_122603 [Macrolepiota fuliginosa MF-IS2]
MTSGVIRSPHLSLPTLKSKTVLRLTLMNFRLGRRVRWSLCRRAWMCLWVQILGQVHLRWRACRSRMRRHRSMWKGWKKGRKRDKGKGKEKEKEQPSADENAMEVDGVDVSPAVETTIVERQAAADDGEEEEDAETMVQPDELDELRTKFISLNELWENISHSLDQVESSWLSGVKEMYQDLVLEQQQTVQTRVEQHKTRIEERVVQLKSDISRIDDKVTATSKSVDGVVDETAQALEKVLHLRQERDTLLADHKQFFEEVLPGYKTKFEAYEVQREKDQKRYTVLETALNAYVKRPPSPPLPMLLGTPPFTPLDGMDTAAFESSTSLPSATSSSSTIIPTSPSSSSTVPAPSSTSTTAAANNNHKEPIQSSPPPHIPNYILAALQPHLITLLRKTVKPLLEEMRKRVEETVNAQKEEIYGNVWKKMEFTYQVLGKVQKNAEVDIGAILGSAAAVAANGSGGGGDGGDFSMMGSPERRRFVSSGGTSNANVAAGPSGSGSGGTVAGSSQNP